MIDYNKQFIDQDDIASVKKILKSKFLTQGNTIKAFENKLSLKFKSKYCSVLSNGTAALHLAIKSLNLKKNSKILTTPISFISTASSIIINNFIPVFADIEEDYYTLDPNKVEHMLKKDKSIKAVIGVDYAGQPCDWEALNYLKKKYNFFLLNDNCHAMGSKLKNDSGYAVKYADLVTQSYHAIKNFTTGEGGSILTNNKKLHQVIELLRTHNVLRRKKELQTKGRWFYKVDEIGFNYRLTDIQAGLGISQLKKLDKFVKRRRKIADTYNELFKNEEKIILPKVKKKNYHSYHLYPIKINFKKLKIDKKKFFLNLHKKNINLQVHYIPLYYQPFIKKYFLYNKKNLINSQNFYESEVSLPIFYNLLSKDQNYIVKSVLSELKK